MSTQINGLELVRAAIKQVNESQGAGDVVVETSEYTVLLGSDEIDSLGVVNILAAVEEQIEKATGEIVVLVDEAALSDESHPLRTVGSLATYVEKVIARLGNG